MHWIFLFLQLVKVNVLGLSRFISSHIILFILSAEHYSFYQPNSLYEIMEVPRIRNSARSTEDNSIQGKSQANPLQAAAPSGYKQY